MNNSEKWGVFFDLDGVLIDSPDAHARAWAKTFKPFGIELPLERLHVEEGRKSLEIAHRIAKEYRLDITEDELIDLIERKRDYYRQIAPSGMRKDARFAVDKLKAETWTLGLVSGSVRQNLETALDDEELALFDVIVTAECYDKGKPDPEPYLTACREAGLNQTRCVAVENAPLGIKSARSAGMKVVALTSTLNETALREADKIINELTVLPEILRSFRE